MLLTLTAEKTWWNIHDENEEYVGVIHTTQHPTIKYEVFSADHKMSERCATVEEGISILKTYITKGDNYARKKS